MKTKQRDMTALLELQGVSLRGANERELVRNMSLSLGAEQAASHGRVRWGGAPCFVPQEMSRVPTERIEDAIRSLKNGAPREDAELSRPLIKLTNTKQLTLG